MSKKEIKYGKLGDRIRQAIDKSPKKQGEIATLIGTDASQISRWSKGRVAPTYDKLIQISKATEVSLGWLVGGEGDATQKEKEIYQLPVFDVQAGAGDGREIVEERVVDHFPVKLAWIKQDLRLNPENLVIISARGDSMEPTLRNEDLIIIDKSQFEVLDDAIYIVNMEGLLMVKRLQRLLGGRLCIKSDNPAYKDQLVEKEQLGQVHVVGRVVWVGRRM